MLGEELNCPETARESEVETEMYQITNALDCLQGEFDELSNRLLSIAHENTPENAKELKDRKEPQTKLAGRLFGYTSRINNLKHDIVSLRNRLEL